MMSQNSFINPFRYVAGTRALVIGLAGMLLTAIIAWYSKTHFDGVLDAHFGMEAPLSLFIIEGVISWLCAVVCFYVAGMTLTRSSVRIVDIAGTIAFARLPMIFVALVGFFVSGTPVNIEDIHTSFIVAGVVGMLFTIWMVTWMYQAYIISSNLKGAKGIISFIVTLIVAEVVSKLLFSLDYFDSFNQLNIN